MNRATSSNPGLEGQRADSASEEQLLARARSGDDVAAAALVARIRGRVYRWALLRTGDPDDAEDVTQQVGINLMRSLRRFDGRSSFGTWVYTITRNAAHDLMRRAAWRDKRAVEAEATDAVAVFDWSQRMTESRLLHLVQTFFRELPPRQREVMDLVDMQGFGAHEAARMMDIDPVTARTHLLRARRTLRARILAARPELVEDR